jgi:hypothetical protein
MSALFGLILGGGVTAVVSWNFLLRKFPFKIGFGLSVFSLVALSLILVNIIQIQIVTLNEQRRMLIVQHQWLRMFCNEKQEFPFESIQEIQIRNFEQAQLVLKLYSGKAIYLRSQLNSVNKARASAEQVATILGKHEVAAGIWQ